MEIAKTMIKGFTEYSRKAATEGIVLLKNESNVLPIKKDETLSLFGRCQFDYYKSGTGSGGAVNVIYNINAVTGIRNNKNISLNEELVSVYEEFIKENPFDNGGGGWAQEPWFQQEMELTDDIVKNAKSKSDKAAIIIGRTAGEDKDNLATKGSYYLTDKEISMIEKVTNHFDQVVIIFNVANIIDMSFLNDFEGKINGLLYSWQGGMEGGNALADVLSGDVSPSGKLSDTIAINLSDYPSASNFGNDLKNYYEEDIYVGYRYFETFNKSAVMFPFGFGLSYTSFDYSTSSVKIDKDNRQVSILIDVKNTGEFSGKEVIQVYVEKPQGKLGKPFVELVSFKKTPLLQPNEEITLELDFALCDIASYDDSGVTGYKSAYVCEEGLYNFYIGTNVREIEKVAEIELDKLEVVEQLTECLAPIESVKRMKPGKRLETGEYELTYEDVPQRTVDLEKRINDNLPTEIPYTGNVGITLQDVYNNKAGLNDFIGQLSVYDLAVMSRGEGMSHPLVTPGTAAAFGGVAENLHDFGIPAACCADGPSGIRMDSGMYATQMPIGTLLACTFNVPMMEKLYEFEGRELVLNNIDSLLGPGLNIHRHPLNGRNFEYFSEDPLVTGLFSKAATLGMYKSGSSGTLKHYAANDQEKERHHIDAVASERCLREIHLKGFEIAVKEGKAESIMTAYNPINGIQAASNYDLNTTILRGEWNFKGIVMTDWWAQMNDCVTGGKKGREYASQMVRAQNDLYMVVNNHLSVSNPNNDDIEEAVKSGKIQLSELQRNAKNILEFIMRAPVIKRDVKRLNSVSFEPLESLSDAVSSNKIEFNTLETKELNIEILEDGEYIIEAHIRYDKDSLAQAAHNFFINDTFHTNLQQNGTLNRWVSKDFTQVGLSKGFYKIKLEVRRPGLEIGSLIFKKQ